MLGIAAYAEHFALLPVVAGALVLWRGGREWRPITLLTCGILFGLGLLIRQSAALFVIGAVVYLLVARGDGIAERPRVGRVGATAVFLAGAAAPLALTCLALWAAGTFRTFWFWVFSYARYYQADPATGWSNLVRTLGAVAPSTSVVLALAAVGLAAVVRDPTSRPADLRPSLSPRPSLPGNNGRSAVQAPLLLAGRTGAGAALRYRTGRARRAARRASGPARSAGRCRVPWASSRSVSRSYASRAVLFELGPGQVSRAIYGRNPFPESVEVARYIREHSAAGDRVAVVGSEPQIYFYSARRSATGYIYTYPLMELQPYASAMQREMIKEIEAAAPRFLVFVSATRSWIARPGSDQTIFGWFEAYQRGFTRVGVVDIPPQQETVYRWGDAAAGYAPRSDVWLMVFERARPQ